MRQKKQKFTQNYGPVLRFKSEAKISDFQANFELYYEFLFGFKSEKKPQKLTQNHDFVLRIKSEAKIHRNSRKIMTLY